MEKLIIEKTFSTPQINFDPDTGLLEIEGKSIPEDAKKMYAPIFQWIDKNLPLKVPATVRVRLYYYNTNSAKQFFNLLKIFEGLHNKGAEIKIRWEYEEGDEDTFYDGQDYKNLLSIPFEVVQV